MNFKKENRNTLNFCRIPGVFLSVKSAFGENIVYQKDTVSCTPVSV